jgi:hypothetical protein
VQFHISNPSASVLETVKLEAAHAFISVVCGYVRVNVCSKCQIMFIKCHGIKEACSLVHKCAVIPFVKNQFKVRLYMCKANIKPIYKYTMLFILKGLISEFTVIMPVKLKFNNMM